MTLGLPPMPKSARDSGGGVEWVPSSTRQWQTPGGQEKAGAVSGNVTSPAKRQGGSGAPTSDMDSGSGGWRKGAMTLPQPPGSTLDGVRSFRET